MNKKAKLIATLSTLCLALAVMVFAVYAATTVTFKVTTNVSFVATKHVKATITARDSGATSTKLTKDSTYSNLATQGADQTITVNPNGETVDGSGNKIDGLQDVAFAPAELTATNKYYGYQIKITNNDTQNALPISVTAQNITKSGYKVTFDGATTTTIESNAVHTITCILEVTDLAGNTVKIENTDLALEIFLGEKVSTEEEPEAVASTPIPEEALTVESTGTGNEAILIDIDDSKISTTSQYSAVPRSSTYTGKQLPYSIPSTVTQGGVEYTIVGIGNGSNAVLSSNGTEITELIIPDSVTEINDYAFKDCKSLTSITISDGVEKIGFSAFFQCSGLTSVEIPGSVTSIGGNAFCSCSNLITVTIQNGNSCRLKLANNIFQYCSNLLSITMPTSLEVINYPLFSGCYRLAEIIDHSTLNVTHDTAEVHKGTTRITKDEQFYYYTNLNDEKCIINLVDTSLRSIIIPDDVKHINQYAFNGYSDIYSVKIPNSVTTIKNRAFYECYKLFEVINNSAINIQKNSQDNGYVGKYAKEVHSGETKLSEQNGLYIYSNGTDTFVMGVADAFSYSIEIPEGVTTITESAFKNCSNLTSVYIPDSVATIPSNVFEGCNENLIIYCESESEAEGWDYCWNYISYYEEGEDWYEIFAEVEFGCSW